MKTHIQRLSLLLLLPLWMACNGTQLKPTATETAAPPARKDRQLDRFESVIDNYEEEDRQQPVGAGEIIFTGSSSIRMWRTLKEDLAPLPVHNRGFGGSTLPEVIHYADRIVFPYEPRVIVLYCGENDIADGAAAAEVFQSFKQFAAMVEKQLPETELVFLAMKPSVARWHLWKEYQKGNQQIRDYIRDHKHMHYLAVDAPMLDTSGEVDSTIFIKDMLHMNPEGYVRWTKVVKPFLVQLYDQQQ